ncbi:restriction endonuclease subunit S, partial [Campylobacter hominis]|uniref:restriction endonuclease subunit S n=1 Tax=Campylobacter hominis TaxID=76517 RepID=UPI00248A95AA
KLGTISDVLIGEFIHQKLQKPNGKYPVYNGGVSNTGYYDKFNRNEDKIIISARGENAGYVNKVTRKFWSGNSCYTINLKSERIHWLYLYFYLRHNYLFNLKARQEATIPSVSKKDVSNLIIKCPKNNEQKAIAETLMTFDRHIENLERLIEKKKMIRDGAVEDLMTGKTRLDGFEDKWEEVKLGTISDVLIGEFIHQKLQKPNGKYPVYNGGVSNTGYYDKFNRNEDKIIISARGENAGYVNKVTRKFWSGNSCYTINLKSERIHWLYLYFYLRHNYLFNLKARQEATIPSVSKKDVSNLIIKCPKNNEQKAIASILTAMDNEIEDLEKEKAKIEKIKVGAMDDLLTGSVRLI